MQKIAAVFLVLLALALPAAAQTAVPQSREQIRLSYAPLVKKAAPAVVNIYTSTLIRQRVLPPLFNDPIFQHFFGGALPPGMTRERMENSLGSGVLVRSDGLIVTSAHVIEGADEIRIVLSDRREFEAKLVTTDAQTDLAVLRLDSKGEILPYLELADSDAAEVGDLVIAIGNPFGVGQTVTSGIISALARTGVGFDGLNYFIQTDAAINPGNSGGALVGMDGRLAGINAAIFSPNGGNLGIGFAVPANMVRTVIDSVEQGQKRVVRPWLGLSGQDVTPELAQSLGLPRPSGVLVSALHPASPALQAGIRTGDVITALNGRMIEDIEAMRFRVATLPVGGSAAFGIMRKGAAQDIICKLITAPEIPPRQTTTVAGRNPLTGAVVANISPAVAEEIGLRAMIEEGVVVTDVKPRSTAARFGLKPGDVVVAVNGVPAASVTALQAVLGRAWNGWQIRLRRGDQMLNIVL